jgi:hypothetical protein
MHTLACNGIEVGRQRGGQGFTLTRAHLCNLAVVQGNTARELHIKVAHFHDALGAFADHRKSLGQQIIQALASGKPITEALRLALELIITQTLEAGLQSIDALDGFAVLLKQAVVAAAENLGKEWDGHVYLIHLQRLG